MGKEKPSQGICSTCNNREACTRQPAYRPPVFFCEQFDSSSEPADERRGDAAHAPEKDLDTTMGLCCNCGNSGSCGLCGMPGGIWHCEEYI